MATYIDREQIRHRRAIQRRYDDDQRRLAALIAMLLLQFSGGGALPTDTRTRLALRAAIWAQVLKPYFVGWDEPFRGDMPQSPYARLMRDGIEGAIRIQVKRQQSLLKRYIKDAYILYWFLSPTGRPIALPPVGQPEYRQPFYAYVDPRGFTLNDRITANAVDVRAKTFRMIDWHIANGDTAEATGAALTNFMTIAGRMTRKPYGDYGSYAPWRGLRSEMLLQAGRATVIGSELNPVVDRIWWSLSTSHFEIDICDNNASGGPNGDGIYPVDEVPPYPNHPGELCSLVPVADENMGRVKSSIEQYIKTNNDIALRWRGTMDEESLVRALMTEEYKKANPLTGQNLRGVSAVRLAPRRSNFR